jgi:phosphate uptake regulator
MSFHIETRKVQQTGGSSYIISLPKGWIREHNVKKNDTLGILSQPDGNLLVTPYSTSQEYVKKKEFTVKDNMDSDYLFRL